MKHFLHIIWLLSVSISFGQQPVKIGLTLSGGGAKGLAHIGILKAIDSAGLKIDLVTGTSMGSIVGGLYAAGYSSDAIEKMAREIDWKVLLTNNVSMRSYIMEEKSEYGKYAAELTLSNGKIGLPTGFLESQELWMKLQDLFFPVAHIKNFDQLPIPFRCVATNLATGEAETFKSGDIVTAIRSSMAIPGVFSAVDRDGKRYVDGGVVKNFPVKDAIEMGATYTIGVSVSTPLEDVKDLDNPFKILTQVVFLNEEKDRILESKLCNLLIDIPMGDFTSGSFSQGNSIIDLGIEEGRKYYPYFKKLADSLNHVNIPDHKPQPAQTVKIKQVTVSGFKKGKKESFFEQFNLQIPGEYNSSQLTAAIRNAFAYRMYKNITYTLLPEASDSFTMACRVVPEAAATLKAALNYNTFQGFSVIGNLTFRNYSASPSRTFITINAGDNFRAMAEHLQMFGYRKPWSNRTQFTAEHQDIPFYKNFKQQGGYNQQYYSIDNLFVNSARRRWSGGLGARWEYNSLNPSITIGNSMKGHNHFITLYSALAYNSQERPFFPAKGTKIDLQFGYVLGLKPEIDFYENGIYTGNLKSEKINYNNYLRITLDAKKTWPLSPKWANITQVQSGINFGPHQSILNSFVSGGMTNVMHNQITFAGLREAKIISESIASFHTGFRWNLLSDAYISITGNAMVYDFIKKSSTTISPDMMGGAGLTFGYNLPIGPFEYTVMYGGKGAGWTTYLNVGFPFNSQ